MRVYTFIYRENFPDESLEQAREAIHYGLLRVEDLQEAAKDPNCWFN